jgi:Putative beta-barrel porin-2, OmpL-like. bbp2
MEGVNMKKAVLWMTLVLALFAFRPASGEEAPKPLGPGWLSLDGSVGLLDKQIEDGKSALEKALFGIGISGFFDTSWTLSTNQPGSPSNITGRYFDKDQNKLVFNNFNLTLDKPEKDWGIGFHIVGDFGRTGELLREATLWNDKLQKQPSAELREAFLTFTIPLGEGIQVKGGKFVTPLGTEILPAPGAYNDNISRSFLFNFGVPLTHTGALFSYPALKTLTVSIGPVTGWDDPHDNNGQPSVLGGINFTPADVFAFASNLIYGPEQRHNSGNKRFTWSNVATIKPIDPLTLYLEYTYGHEENVTASLRDGTWQGWGAIASYNWTDRFNTALRGEVFKDSDGVRTALARDVKLAEVTLTGSYKFTAKFLGRGEIRNDWASKSFFSVGSSGRTDQHQMTLALQAIYTF